MTKIVIFCIHNIIKRRRITYRIETAVKRRCLYYMRAPIQGHRPRAPPPPLSCYSLAMARRPAVTVGIVLPHRSLPRGPPARLHRWHMAQGPRPGDWSVLCWPGPVSRGQPLSSLPSNWSSLLTPHLCSWYPLFSLIPD